MQTQAMNWATKRSSRVPCAWTVFGGLDGYIFFPALSQNYEPFSWSTFSITTPNLIKIEQFWLSKNQNLSNYSDQKQREQTARMKRSELLSIDSNLLKGGMGFGFASHWLNSWSDVS